VGSKNKAANMERTVERRIDGVALCRLVIVTFASGAAFWLAWNHFQISTALHQATRARGFVSDFGQVATGISAVAIPLMIWLFRKAFFSKYNLGQ
jgi:hypothetical protein